MHPHRKWFSTKTKYYLQITTVEQWHKFKHQSSVTNHSLGIHYDISMITGLTLEKKNIDIKKIERQDIAFTAISWVTYLDGF